MELAATIASAILAWVVAAGGLVGWYASRRAAQLRKDDVLAWALASIDAMQTLVIVCREAGKSLPDGLVETRLQELVIRTSVLIEQGRLYFRNVPSGHYGSEKPHAYQGLRPKILDYLVVGHATACSWATATPLDRRKMGYVAEEAARQFVSTVQKEVGRDCTAFDGAAERGLGVHLPSLIRRVDESMLQEKGWL
jgi:hypothetical protein